MGVATVVLGASDGEAVTEAVELLWVNRIDQKAAFEQRLDNRAVWHLDGHRDDRRLGPRRYQQPDTHLSKPGPAVGKSSLADDFALASTRQTWWVCVAQSMPTNHRASSIIIHLPFAAGPPRCAIIPCTGALGATSHWTCIAATPPGRASSAGALGTGGQGCSRQIGPCCQSTSLDWSQAKWYRMGGAKRYHRDHERDDGYRFAHPSYGKTRIRRPRRHRLAAARAMRHDRAEQTSKPQAMRQKIGRPS